jgi:hypothetical protein
MEATSGLSSASWGLIRNRDAVLSSDVDVMKALGGGRYPAEATAATWRDRMQGRTTEGGVQTATECASRCTFRRSRLTFARASSTIAPNPEPASEPAHGRASRTWRKNSPSTPLDQPISPSARIGAARDNLSRKALRGLGFPGLQGRCGRGAPGCRNLHR